MKKIYLFLALAIAVAINANATYYFNVWHESNELYKALKAQNNWAFSEDGTYTFSTPLTITQPEMFLINDGTNYYKSSTIVPNNQWSVSSGNSENLALAPGTYTSVTFDGSTLTFVGEKTTAEYGYKLHVWENGANVLNNLPNTYLKKIADNKYELVFDAPITLSKAEEFGFRNSSNQWMAGCDKESATNWIWVGGDYSKTNMKLKPGTYYSVTLTEGTENGNYVKFNTYAETKTGLDAVLSKAADYVGIATDIFVQEHHVNHYSVYTTQSSTYVAPTPEQDTKYYGDDPEKFEKRDWFRIWAPVESEKNGMHFAAGTIVEIASGKAVKWGDVISGETSFTPNLYRPLNFNATAQDKDVMYIFQPQEGEVLQVRGKFAKEGENEFLTDEKAEHKVGLLGFTENKMTEGQWYTLDGHLCGNAVYYTGFATATGVESVETANATVFAANGTINVSSEAQAAIEVYTANGQMVRAINADNASIAVAPGFYLVKVDSQVSKVIVK